MKLVAYAAWRQKQARVLCSGVILMLIVGPSTEAAGSKLEVSFVLVPEQHWNGRRPNVDKALPAGNIFLYKGGSYEPELVLTANEPHELPSGNWIWTGEGEGFVTVAPGEISVNLELLPEDTTKRVIWPVVPACEITLTPTSEWRAIERLDIASLSTSAVYPVNPKTRRAFWLPEGRSIAYSTRAGELLGIKRLLACKQNAVLEVAPPEPPGATTQDLLVHALLPKQEDLAKGDLAVVLQTGQGTHTPDGLIWSVRRGSFFFLDIPATSSELQLHLQHPELRTTSHHLESLGGSVREIPDISLRPRRTASLTIDFRPIRRHERTELELLHCGRDRHPRSLDLDSVCHSVARATPLEEGVATYTFDRLDDGYYHVRAVIDDEILDGLLTGVSLFVDPEEPSSDPVDLPGAIPLWEFEISGQLLQEDEAVAGEVLLTPIMGGATRRFPTDEHDTYHLYYFGRLPPRSNKTDLTQLGLYITGGYQLAACDDEQSCRVFSSHTMLIGGGTLDLDLGVPTEIHVRVLDARTNEPVAGALVFPESPPRALHFEDGKATWEEPQGQEGVSIATDSLGTVRIRNLEAGRQRFNVVKEGYKLYRGALDTTDVNAREVEIHLIPDNLREGISLVSDGEPLANAFLVIKDGQNAIRGCSLATNKVGAVQIPERCLDSTTAVILHPKARMTPIDAEDLKYQTDLKVHPAPTTPLRLRITDAEGRPIAGAAVELHFNDTIIGPQDLLSAMTRSRTYLFFLTDDRGEITLRGVDPTAPEAPTARILLGNETISTLPLSPYRIGELVEVSIDQ